MCTHTHCVISFPLSSHFCLLRPASLPFATNFIINFVTVRFIFSPHSRLVLSLVSLMWMASSTYCSNTTWCWCVHAWAVMPFFMLAVFRAYLCSLERPACFSNVSLVAVTPEYPAPSEIHWSTVPHPLQCLPDELKHLDKVFKQNGYSARVVHRAPPPQPELQTMRRVVRRRCCFCLCERSEWKNWEGVTWRQSSNLVAHSVTKAIQSTSLKFGRS